MPQQMRGLSGQHPKRRYLCATAENRPVHRRSDRDLTAQGAGDRSQAAGKRSGLVARPVANARCSGLVWDHLLGLGRNALLLHLV